jgi:transcriptional regulator GlxA family with amidase domain
MEVKSQCRLIAIVIPPNAQSMDMSGPMDAFLEAKRLSGGNAEYKLHVVAMSADKMVMVGGMCLVADSSIFDEDRSFDTLLIVGSADFRADYERAEVQDWLRRHKALARRYGSIGTGAFFLGAAGLLDGMRATTHWHHTAELAQRFPAADILADHIYVKDGALFTSAGVTAGIDLALKLVEADHGRELARKVARRLVVALKDSGRQSQFSAHLAAQSVDEDRMKAMQHWILDHLTLDLTIKALAGRAAMGVRHFTRVFKREAGITPGDFVDMARVDTARRLLADSDMPLDSVAKHCGFTNSDVMRRAFLRKIGTGPGLYRQRASGWNGSNRAKCEASPPL